MLEISKKRARDEDDNEIECNHEHKVSQQSSSRKEMRTNAPSTAIAKYDPTLPDVAHH